MRTLPSLAIVSAALLSALVGLAGCGGHRAAPPLAVDDLRELRTYGFDTIADPQASWNPDTYQILARIDAGFVLLDEGRDKQDYYRSSERRETVDPVWINRNQFAFGPGHGLVATASGREVPSSQGLTVVTIGSKDGKRTLDPQTLTKTGYRPRVWADRIIAQAEDKIIVVDHFGAVSEFGPGFYAEPQRNGRGVTFQEAPVLEADRWTGLDLRRGRLFIRWKPGQVTTLANAIEARWTAAGGVVATVLRNDPPQGRPWWEAGTDVYLVAGPEAQPVLIAKDARSPAPHPGGGVVAVVSREGAIDLVDEAGAHRRNFLDQGDHPEWSTDGTRLLVEQVVQGKPDARYLRVSVLRLGAPLPAPAAAPAAP